MSFKLIILLNRIVNTSNHLPLEKFLLVFIVAVISLFQTDAQTQTILVNGIVLDEESGTPIEQVIIYIPERSFYSESKLDGHFSIQLPDQAEWNLKFNRLGYQTKELVLKKSDVYADFILKLSLKKSISKEIEIVDKKDTEGATVREQVESFQLLPSVNSNLESILPVIGLGVRSSAGGELSSQYSVRGGSYDENLVFVNDFEVFRPQLIRNGQQEGLSFPNPDLIKDLKFSSGGFESRYGDKMSSVLDIRYKTPDRFRSSLVLSPLGASAHLEGSKLFSKDAVKKFSYLLGVRYKTTKYLLSSLDVEGEYQPNFLDIQSFLSYSFNKNWKLSWIANFNKSVYKLIPESSSVAKGSFFQVINLNTVFEGAEEDVFEQNMSGLSLNYFSDNKRNPYFFKLISSIHQGYEAEQFDILGYYRLVEVEAGNTDEKGKEVKLWGEGTQHLYNRDFLNTLIWNQEARAGIEFNFHSIQHFVQAGIFWKNEHIEDKINEWERLDSAGYSLPYDESRLVLNYVYKTQNNFTNNKMGFWLQDDMSWLIASKQLLKITPGLRFHHSDLNRESFINPRLKLEWIPVQNDNRMHVWLAGGWYYQPPFYREMRLVDGNLNFNQQAQKSNQLLLGIQRDFRMPKISPSQFRWISEIYYKNMWDLVSYDLENVRIRYSGLNDSKAYAIGWDNRIYGEFVPGAESWVNISFLRTRERLNGIQHKERDIENPSGNAIKDVPRPTDQLFALGMYFQDYLPKNDRFKMHLNINVAGGLPYGLKGDNLIFRNDKRLKAYHRVDIGFSFLMWDQNTPNRGFRFMNFTRQTWLSLEVFNLLKVKNEASVSWIKSLYNYQFAIPNYLSSRRINLKLRMDF